MHVSRAATLLGVSPTASLDEVKRSFREKAKALHPDTAGANQSDDATFAELVEAYEILTNRAGETSATRVDPLGPGMRARMEAAKNWREKAGTAKGVPMRPAREGGGSAAMNAMDGGGLTGGRAPASSPSLSDEEELAALLSRHRRARSSPGGTPVPGTVARGAARGSKLVGAAVILSAATFSAWCSLGNRRAPGGAVEGTSLSPKHS